MSFHANKHIKCKRCTLARLIDVWLANDGAANAALHTTPKDAMRGFPL